MGSLHSLLCSVEMRTPEGPIYRVRDAALEAERTR
jgi:hypothetical protein